MMPLLASINKRLTAPVLSRLPLADLDAALQPDKMYASRGQFTRNEVLKAARYFGFLPQLAEALQ